ncbi:UNVERIFIED_CONTAM: hypothetical protein RF648_17990, partial [Kocuria sp. CPCC 205274]
KRLLLIIDNRGTEKIYYKEFVGFTLRKLKPWDKTTNKEPHTTFVKTLKLYDPAINQVRKQKVLVEVLSVSGKVATIGVK